MNSMYMSSDNEWEKKLVARRHSLEDNWFHMDFVLQSIEIGGQVK